MTDALLITRSGDTERWTLNHPGTRNALSGAMVEDLMQACQRAAGDAALRFVVLQGAGGAFCAGGSLGSFVQAIGMPLAQGEADPLVAVNARFGALLATLEALPQILLVAVEGPAMGGGIGLVCCADFVLAAPSAVFATPEVTLGVVPAQIVPVLHRRLGDRLARQMLLSGDSVSAQQALAWGLVDDVAGDLEAAVQRRLAALRRAAPGAVAHTKALLFMANQPPAHDLSGQAAIKFAANLRSAEAAEGLAAFAAKRPARWVA